MQKFFDQTYAKKVERNGTTFRNEFKKKNKSYIVLVQEKLKVL